MMRHYWVHDIEWDIDGEDVDLPTDVEVPVDEDDAGISDEILEEYLSDWLTEEYGFCHKGFVYMEINRGKQVGFVK